MSDPTCLAAALDYAKRGWRVLALSPGSKVPLKDDLLQPNGSLSATTDTEHIRKLWGLYPLANVGIATGKESNLTVVDFDGPEAQQALTAVGLRVPKTRVVKTRKGYHVYLAYDPDLKQGARLMPALDIRNDGGYVVAPPSVVDGVTYTVFKDNPLGEWPELTGAIAKALADKQHQKPASDVQHPGWVSELLASGAPEGQRNDAASRLAGYFRSINIPQDIAFASLLGFARACQPPMAEGELQAIVTSVWRYRPSKALTYQGQVLPSPIEDANIANRRVFRWPEQNVSIQAERIREHSDGVSAWLTVSVGDMGVIFGPKTYNALAPRTAKEWTDQLNDRHPENWSAMLQHVTAALVAALQGTAGQLIDMADYKPNARQPYLIYPFAVRGLPSLLYGDGGTGKSTLLIACCLSLALGKSVIPGVTVTAPGNSLYLDWEADSDAFYHTLNALAAGAGVAIPPGRIKYRHPAGPLADHLETLQHDVIEHDIALVCPDSLVRAAGSDVTEAEAARIYYQTMGALGKTSVAITHITKNGRDSKPYGSVFFWNYARNIWLATKADPEDATNTTIGLYHQKVNMGAGRPSRPFGLTAQIETDDNNTPTAIRYSAADVTDEPGLAKRLGLKERIIARLKQGPASNSDIANALGIQENQARALMYKKSWRDVLWQQSPPTMQWVLCALPHQVAEQPKSPVAQPVAKGGATPLRSKGEDAQKLLNKNEAVVAGEKDPDW